MSLLFGPRETRSGFPNANDVLAAARSMRNGNGATPYNVRDALQVASVVACVGLRAGAFAQLPLKGYRDGAQATLLSPQPELLRSPSDVVVPSVWKTQMSISRDLWGFALGRVTAWDAALYPKRAEWIDPSCVTWDVKGGMIEWRIDRQLVDSSLLIHIPSRFVLPGCPVGMSPLERSGLVDLAKRAQDFGREWFQSGAVPSAIIRSDQVLTSEQADTLLQIILQRWRNRQPAVIGKGMEYEQVSVKANESQFLETVRQAAADVAVSFNMPPDKVAAAITGSRMTYGNREQDQQQYLTDSINPDLVIVQESLDRHSPRTQFCRFTTGAFLRSDLTQRYQSYEIGIRSRFMTPNEARALEEMEPLPGGDTFSTPAPAMAARDHA